MGAPVVDAIYALTNYPAPRGFDFEIAGRNFKSSKEGNYIEIVDLRTLEACETQPRLPTRPLVAMLNGKQPANLCDRLLSEHYYGPVKIRVHIGNSVFAGDIRNFCPAHSARCGAGGGAGILRDRIPAFCIGTAGD